MGTARFKALGVAFIALLLAGVWLTYALFSNSFADFERVTLHSSKIGLQLPERADVKMRGAIVGEVLDFEPTAEGAELTLGIFPDEIDTVPANVTGRIEPKTLFGQKEVQLVIPEEEASDSLQAGSTIERTDVSIEVEKVLSDLYPLLRTVQPVELNQTLTALATALEGRGEDIGENLETLDSYLKRINPEIPALVEDLRMTADVSDTYAGVMPQVAETLRNSLVTTGTLEGREERLNTLFTDVARFSGVAEGFLADNRENLVRLGEVGAQQLRVLEKYAPQFPCLTEGIVGAGALQAEAFRNYTLHINLELLPNQPRAYDPGDTPRFGADRGAYCGGLPDPPWSQDNPYRDPPNFDDGVDRGTGKGTMRPAPGGAPEEAAARGPARDSAAGFVGSAAEDEVLRSVLAPVLGTTTARVDDLGVLLVGPMARGAEVSLQ